jgi:probable HAF family extracellular repeat protein
LQLDPRPALVSLLLVAAPSGLAAQAFFTGVGHLPGSDPLSRVEGVSGDGSVVCGYDYSSKVWRPFVWTLAQGLEVLDAQPGVIEGWWTHAVSSDGRTIVGYGGAPPGVATHALRWHRDLAGDFVISDIGDLAGGWASATASGVDADGSVIVGWSSSTLTGLANFEGFAWSDPAAGGSGMVALGDLPGGPYVSGARACSADGSRIVGYASSLASQSNTEAAVWSASTGWVGLGDLPGGNDYSDAYDVSADGSVIVGWSEAAAGTFAFRWTDPASGGAGMQSLGDLPGGSQYSSARSISSDGATIVGTSTSATALEAFIWTEAQGMRSLKGVLESELGLDLTGWKLLYAMAVSDDGRTIVGEGIDPLGHNQGWVAYLGADPWTDLGHGLPGSAGTPVLQGTGTLLGGKPMALALNGAASLAPAFLCTGIAPLAAPFKGGILVPTPTIVVALGTDAGGELDLPATWPMGLPSGLQVYFQAWIVDAAGPAGFAASNGLRATLP